MSEAEYLAFERDPARVNEERSELLAHGEVRQMAGVSLPHNRIVINLTKLVGALADEAGGLEEFASDLKVRPPACRYFYPDYGLAPDPPQVADDENDVLLDPLFNAEILSDSTESLDRGEKRDCYLATPSVVEYWLVHQDAMHVERHHRDPGGDWGFTEYTGPDAAVPLPPVAGGVRLSDLYRRVPGVSG